MTAPSARSPELENTFIHFANICEFLPGIGLDAADIMRRVGWEVSGKGVLPLSGSQYRGGSREDRDEQSGSFFALR